MFKFENVIYCPPNSRGRRNYLYRAVQNGPASSGRTITLT